MSNKVNSTKELLSDETFQDWILAGRKSEYIKARNIVDVEQKKRIDEASTILLSLRTEKKSVGSQKISTQWGKLESTLKTRASEGTSTVSSNQVRPVRRVWAYAAVLALLLGSVFIFKPWSQSTTYITYTTDFGEKTKITLDDGTVVNLNANSSLKLAENFETAAQREVWIQGEGFFDVITDTERGKPFVVHANDLDVHVLGTQFNVRSRQKKVSVSLKEGKIKMSTTTGLERVMKVGEMYTYHTGKKEWLEVQSEGGIAYAWLQNKIVLDETPLIELAETIEFHFGKTVTIERPSLGSSKLSGTIPDHDLEVILDVLQELLEVEIARDDHTIRIY